MTHDSGHMYKGSHVQGVTCTRGHMYKRSIRLCFPSLSSVTSDGVPTTPTTPSATNGPSVPTSYTGVILRDTHKPAPPVPRPRSQTEAILQRIETSPTPQPSAPATPSTPPVPRPRQGSSSKGLSLTSTSSSATDTPPALPPKPSQSPPVSFCIRFSAVRDDWSPSTSLLSYRDV